MVSPKSVTSEHCLRELTEAVKLNKRLVPINFASVEPGALPDPVSSHNWIPSQGRFEDDFADSLESLIDASQTDLDWVRQHTKWGNLAVAWEAKQRDKSLLVRGSELQVAERWLAGQAGKEPAPTPLHSDYILAGRSASTRRQRLTLTAVTAALAVSAILAIFAVVQRNEAASQEQIAVSRELASGAIANLKTDPELSLLLAIEAGEAGEASQAEEALRKALAESHVRTTLRGHAGTVWNAIFSPDGDSVVTSNLDGTARIWDVASGEQTAVLRAPVISADFSPDGDSVATAG